MTAKKHPGGRGRRAENKHETFSISLPPHLKALLDSWVTPEVSRSEVIAHLVEQHHSSLESAPAAPKLTPTSTPQKPLKAPSRPSQRKGGVKRTNTERLALHVPALGVMQKTVPRGLGWKPERYEQTNALLSQGDVLLADGVNYRTSQGEIMGYKTVEALVRLGVLVPA